MARDSGEGIDQQALVTWTQRLARRASPQTDLFEAEPQVQSMIGDVIAPLLKELGLPSRRDRMGNLLVELGEGSTRDSLLLTPYAMTHPASAMTNPWGGEIVERGGKPCIRGRGVAEQKACLAAAIAATAAAARGKIRGRLVLAVSTAGETGRHDAVKSIIEALGYAPKLGIVAIGTSGKISLGNKGRLDVNVTVHGKACHSSMPWDGINAIEGLRQVMGQVARLKFEKGKHPNLGKATLTPTFIETGPRATHTVQSRATLTLDRRLLPGQKPTMALREIKRGLKLEKPFKLSVEAGAYMYPCEIKPTGRLVKAIEAGCAAACLPKPGAFWSHGALDAGYLTENGCEAAMWGPGPMELWHKDEEYVAIDDLVAGAKAYLGVIRATVC
jgi:acetylornithine deacetylase